MSVSGARGTINVTQNLRKVEVDPKLYLLQPDQAPLTTITAMMGKKAVANPQFKWFEDDIDARFSSTSTSYNNSATSIVVASGEGPLFKANDIVRVPRTGECFSVTSVSTDTLTVVRGLNSTQAAMNSGEELLILGSAKAEGSTSDTARTVNPSEVSNYTQIFRRPVELTETWIHSDQFVSENDQDYQRRKAFLDHVKDIEETFINGVKSEDTSGSQPRRTTAGALAFATQNITAAGGTLSEASFWAAIRGAYRYGSNTKTAFSAPLVVSALNQYARGKIQVTSMAENTYGLDVVKFQSPFGTLNLVNHWLLEGTTLGGYLLGLDMAQLKYVYLANSKGSRDTHLNLNIQAPDADTQKDEWLSEVGLQFGLAKTHFLITGVTG
jgi:hypothetical protein